MMRHVVPVLAGILVFAAVWAVAQFFVIPVLRSALGLPDALAGLIKVAAAVVCGALVNNALYRRAAGPQE